MECISDQKSNLSRKSTHPLRYVSIHKLSVSFCSTHEDQTGFTSLSGRWCSTLYTLHFLHPVVPNLSHANNCTENSRAHVLTYGVYHARQCSRSLPARTSLNEWEVLIVGETVGATLSHLTTPMKKRHRVDKQGLAHKERERNQRPQR